MSSLILTAALTAAAGFDVATMLAITAGAVGAITGIGATIVQRRDVQTKADTGYVERNLAAMQAIIDRQDVENQHLRAELELCKRTCNECLKRVKTLERRKPAPRTGTNG